MTEQIEFEKSSPQRNMERIYRIKQKILHKFSNAVINKEIGGLVKFNIPEARVSEILEYLHSLIDDSFNFEWSISDSTLEDVFLEVIHRFERAKQSLLGSIGLEDDEE
jgi:hypothetical protein